MLAVYALPTPAPLEHDGDTIALTVNGKACLAVLAFAVTLWVTEALPFAVTSLFVLLLIPVFGIADYATVVAAGFGNPIITFFIGVLILSSGFSRSGLGARLVLHVLRIFGTRTDRVLLGFLSVGAMLSMWITDMAVAAILLPLGVGVLRDARLEPLKSNFGRALMIACAYGPLIGGIATPAGTGANPIAISYLRELTDLDISFLQWMTVGVPAAVLLHEWQIAVLRVCDGTEGPHWVVGGRHELHGSKRDRKDECGREASEAGSHQSVGQVYEAMQLGGANDHSVEDGGRKERCRHRLQPDEVDEWRDQVDQAQDQIASQRRLRVHETNEEEKRQPRRQGNRPLPKRKQSQHDAQRQPQVGPGIDDRQCVLSVIHGRGTPSRSPLHRFLPRQFQQEQRHVAVELGNP